MSSPTTDPDRDAETDKTASKRECLQYTVEYAYEHSYFYREVFETNDIAPADIRTVDDLTRIPITTGEDILANQPPAADTFRFRNRDADCRRAFHTSGSDNTPKTIFLSYDEITAFYSGTGQQGFEHFGLTADDCLVNYNPFVGLNPSCVYVEGAVERIGGTTLPISNTQYPIDQEVDLLRHHNPDVMMGLPSHVAAKGERFRQEEVNPADFDFEAIFVAGEPIGEERQRHIYEMYDSPVRRFYAATELGGIGFDCLVGDGYHVLDERVHVEIIDRASGRRVPNGERGSVVATRLLHPGEESAMPLLRYDVGDVASVESDGDACDCTIGGDRKLYCPQRTDWEFIVGGVNLSVLFVENALHSTMALRNHVEDYQIQLAYDSETGQDVLKIAVEPATRVGGDKSLAGSIRGALLDRHAHLRDTVETVGAARIDVELVGNVEMPPGKPQRLIDHRDR